MVAMLPQCSHITRKRGVFYWRRRLPGMLGREIALSLQTRHFREAEHRAGLIDAAFGAAMRKAMSEPKSPAVTLETILRAELRKALDADIERRLTRQPGTAAYAYWWDPEDGMTERDADLQEIRGQRSSYQQGIARNYRDSEAMEAADRLIERHGLSASLRDRLELGLQEVWIEALNHAERRTLGQEPLVFAAAEVPGKAYEAAPTASPQASTGAPPEPTQAAAPETVTPLLSSLIDPFIERRETHHKATHQVLAQERGTLQRFIEAQGDKPPAHYNRADVTAFLDILRRLPATYGRAHKDKTLPLSALIARADQADSARLKDKTVKRHLSALSQFFQFAVDRNHLTVVDRRNIVSDHQFQLGKARKQRDSWTTDELKTLFASPVWKGRTVGKHRAEPGSEIVRDAKFWLPLLALHHGCRLEEFADLDRRDIAQRDGIWIVMLTEREGRRLKNANAERVVPLHPELIRLGFLDYVAATAPTADDPVFPDLAPQGKDQKRGPRVTRWFVDYRKDIGIYREGVGMHAFRHAAITRLSDAIQNEQQRRHRNFIMGHQRPGGGEGDERYDKGPGLQAMASTLALLRFPEIDLSHLYMREEGDLHSPWEADDFAAKM